MTRGLQITVDVPERQVEQLGEVSRVSGSSTLCRTSLTVNIIISCPEEHFHMIPLQKAALPNERLGEHNILVILKKEGLH